MLPLFEEVPKVPDPCPVFLLLFDPPAAFDVDRSVVPCACELLGAPTHMDEPLCIAAYSFEVAPATATFARFQFDPDNELTTGRFRRELLLPVGCSIAFIVVAPVVRFLLAPLRLERA